MQRGLISCGAIALALVLFFALNILAGVGLGPVRVDLTEDKLFSLSDGSRKVLAKLEEPIQATFYYTQDLGKEFPAQAVGFDVHAFATRVEETLQEFAAESDGKFQLEVVDPEPFSEEEEEASRVGLNGMPAGPSGDVLYLGLVLSNTVGDREVMASLDGRQESFFEYELARRVHTLSQLEPPTVGLITPLAMNGGSFDPMTRQPPDPPWVVMQQLGSLFEVRDLGTDIVEVEDDVDALLIVHPKDLPAPTRYAIDQFVLAGGPAIVFADPQCLTDLPPPDPSNPMSQYMQTPGASDMPDLLRAWGLRMVPGVVAADSKNALRRPSYDRGAQTWEDYPVWMHLHGEECLTQDEAAVGSLGQLWLAQAGELEPVAGAATTFTPLVLTSDQGSRIATSKVTLITPGKELLDSYVVSDEPVVVAARVMGPAQTAFPDGKPTGGAGEDAPGGDPLAGGHLAESRGDIRVVVVSDADMLEDNWSYREQRSLFGQVVSYIKQNGNGDLLLNLVEQLAGSADLIEIRGRGSAYRPFDVVEEIRREATERSREKETELQEKLAETRSRLQELQGEGGAAAGNLFWTPEQEVEVAKFREVEAETRIELRGLQHEKDRDIESLGARIKLLNVLLMPALVLVVGLLFWAVRVGNRKKG